MKKYIFMSLILILNLNNIIAIQPDDTINDLQEIPALLNDQIKNPEFFRKIGLTDSDEIYEFINSMKKYAKLYTILFWLNSLDESQSNSHPKIIDFLNKISNNQNVPNFSIAVSQAYKQGEREGLFYQTNLKESFLKGEAKIYSDNLKELLNGKFGTIIDNY